MKKTVVILGLIVLSGCVSNRVNLLDERAVTLKESVPDELHMNTSVYEDDGNLVVLGRLHRGSLDRRRIPGHIDIDILSSTGEEFANIKASFTSLRSWRRGSNPVAFRAELPGIPPVGSTVHVRYHAVQH